MPKHDQNPALREKTLQHIATAFLLVFFGAVFIR